MPLSPPVPREPIHQRRIECRAYRRQDGHWDLEGHLTDVKTYSFPNAYRGEIKSGEPVHEMWLRLTIDEDLKVHAAEAVTDHGPFQLCPDITPRFAALVGLTIGSGWRRQIRERLGGVHGCTHLVDLLGPLGTTAIQAIMPIRARRRDAAPQRKPAVIDGCHVWRSDGEAVKRHYPAYFTGDR
ncbi:MAG: DUF2889 domain-containing protein [Proteobacteria bacterium]|nr:DUF2889 domain-containing protein [Pseudomonadota bacterium]